MTMCDDPARAPEGKTRTRESQHDKLIANEKNTQQLCSSITQHTDACAHADNAPPGGTLWFAASPVLLHPQHNLQ